MILPPRVAVIQRAEQNYFMSDNIQQATGFTNYIPSPQADSNIVASPHDYLTPYVGHTNRSDSGFTPSAFAVDQFGTIHGFSPTQKGDIVAQRERKNSHKNAVVVRMLRHL